MGEYIKKKLQESESDNMLKSINSVHNQMKQGVTEALSCEISGNLLREIFASTSVSYDPVYWSIRSIIADLLLGVLNPLVFTDENITEIDDHNIQKITEINLEDKECSSLIGCTVKSSAAMQVKLLYIDLLVSPTYWNNNVPMVLDPELVAASKYLKNFDYTNEIDCNVILYPYRKNKSITNSTKLSKAQTDQRTEDTEPFASDFPDETGKRRKIVISMVRSLVLPLLVHSIAHSLSSSSTHAAITHVHDFVDFVISKAGKQDEDL
jgi:hypothetical protein